MLIYEGDAAVARWAAERLGFESFGPCSSIGVERNGVIVAAAVFNNFRWPDIEITFVRSDAHWATPHVVRTILRYPFIQLNCKRITAITEATNHRARGFLCKLGFQQEGYHPDARPSGDAVSFGLLRDAAARWIAEDHGKKLPQHARDT